MTTADSEAQSAPPGPLMRLVNTQAVAFAIVGCTNTAIGFVLYVGWLALLGPSFYNLAVLLSYCISVVIAFVLHRTLVFKVRGNVLRDFARFVLVNSSGLILNMSLMYVAVSILHLPPVRAQVGVLGIVAIVTFFGHRYVSFRRPAGSGPSGELLSVRAER